jgi:hypothetical protein
VFCHIAVLTKRQNSKVGSKSFSFGKWTRGSLSFLIITLATEGTTFTFLFVLSSADIFDLKDCGRVFTIFWTEIIGSFFMTASMTASK